MGLFESRRVAKFCIEAKDERIKRFKKILLNLRHLRETNKKQFYQFEKSSVNKYKYFFQYFVNQIPYLKIMLNIFSLIGISGKVDIFAAWKI
ncbi:hypothetical protein D0817_05735 [Flavobacterium cupreum]|uniref:Uncharacterized protein n=1 Tax=Flavobacterium cupreum TaxID=2133766 RepID=A0A434AAK1_9FLAO|nr:hypothetical protein D0817_05735 [Flavobacterium cupreum]